MTCTVIINNREDWKASRKVSFALSAKIRSGTATLDEEREYRTRDAAESAWSHANASAEKWGSHLKGKSCEELGLMP